MENLSIFRVLYWKMVASEITGKIHSLFYFITLSVLILTAGFGSKKTKKFVNASRCVFFVFTAYLFDFK